MLRDLHVLGPDGRLLATPIAVVCGITYNFLPFMVLPIYVSLEQIDGRLLEAAQDLYATRLRTFLRVTLPLSLPGVFAGTLLTFIPAAGDFINAQLLGSPRQSMIGNVIQSKFLAVTDYPQAAALSFVLMAIILVIVLVYARAAGHGAARRMTAHAAPHAPRPRPARPRLGVRPPQRADRLRGARAALPLPADRGRRRVLVQQPGGPLQLHVDRASRSRTGSTRSRRRGSGTRCSSRCRSPRCRASSRRSLGTLIALALVRYRFSGRGAVNLLIFVPLTTPEIVLGASLLTLFLNRGVATGF